MSPRDIASLAFRLAGVYVIITPLTPLSELLSFLAYDWRQYADAPAINVPILIVGRVLPIAICLVLGSLLIVKSRAFAASVVKDPADSSNALQPVHIHAILFSVVGVLLIGLASRSIPSVFQNIAIALSEYREPLALERRQKLLADTWTWATGVILQFGIGLALLIWSRRLAGSFYRSTSAAHRDEAAALCPHCKNSFVPRDYRPNAPMHLCSHCGKEIPPELLKVGV